MRPSKMPGFCHFIFCLCILGGLFHCSHAWEVQLPNHINGLLGSCLVIPCSFNYYQYPPERPDRVVWYQYVNRGYPLVYDNWYPNDVISAFRGKTYVYTSWAGKTCKLKIEPVTWAHHRQRIYPWVDPENVGKSTYRFYDKTVTINVEATPNTPDISIFGEMKVGRSVTVQCSVHHTCSTKPPSISLNIPLKNHRLDHTYGSDGQTTTTLRTTLLIERDHQTVTCTAQHYGGITATGFYTLSAECSVSQLTISPSSTEFLEGYESKVSCIASYTCPKHNPTLRWNYNMPSSTDTTRVSQEAGWRTVSTLTLTPSANDNGRYLTCYARFTGLQNQQTSITLRVKRNILSRGWSFTTPGRLTGMKGSCMIIPCRFSYSHSQPADLPVAWYLYQSSGYPAVFVQRSSNIVGRFVGKTSLVGSVRENNCSLKIERLELSHSHDRLFPWIDKNPITSYHNMGHSFLDKTTELIVSDQAEEPRLSVIGNLRVGEQSAVTCSVRHTCLSAPPSLTISDIPGTDKTTDTLVSDGIWERRVERTWTVEEQNQRVKCSVSYPGGQKASNSLQLNVECPYNKITMVERPDEATEGVAKSVICTVSYKCEKNMPTIVWNYRDMQSEEDTRKISGNSYRIVSNLTFIGSAREDGKQLTCTARFLTGQTSDSATIHVKRNMFFRGWSATTPRSITGMKGSCVIIPCRFSYSHSQPADPPVTWYLYQSSGYPAVFDQRSSNIDVKFVGKTSLVGSVRENNCSLKIERLELSHSQDRLFPWIDKNPITSYHTKDHNFQHDTTQLVVLDQAEEPRLSVIGNLGVGEQSAVTCSVRHTCLSAPPSLTVSDIPGTDKTTDTLVSDGIWERRVERTWTVEEENQGVKCSVSYPGGQKASSSLQLNVECPYDKITMTERPDEVPEGVPKTLSCTVSHKCKKNTPKITWNYGHMQTSVNTKKISSSSYSTVSSLTFTGSAEDDGKTLTCTAQFTTGDTSDSATIHIKRSMLSRGWSFTTPRSITGMRGSCMIIPCRFSYSHSQPADLPVTWYLYQSSGYPAVFDQRSSNIDIKFVGKTSLVGSVRENNCSLKIERLELSHSRDRLFPWIDKNPITSYHSTGHSFLDKTTELIVSDQAEEPRLSVIGNLRVGEQSTVACSVRHTCLSAPPSLTISDIPGTDKTTDTLVSDGIWERRVERTWTVEEENQGVRCSVSYPGGQKASNHLQLNVECPYDKITMTEQPGEVKEGATKTVTCSVSYKCKKNTPNIKWNDNNEKSSQYTTKVYASSYRTVSTVTFTGSAGDDGKTLTCTAQFLTGETSDSATIRIKSFDVLAADVPIKFSALTRSCVVIPCTFQDDDHVPMTRGIWAKKNGDIVYHNGQSQVVDHFKGRTRIQGNLQEGHCSLEIDDIKPFDNGPFCFHAEKRDDKYKFNNSCVFVLMRASPDEPAMTPVPAEADAGSTLTVSCSVAHTCPSHPPVFSWSVPNLTSAVSHTMTSRGVWEMTSTISFVAAGGDGVHSLNCTATFWGGKQQTSVVNLSVKGSLMYQVKSAAPVFVPVSLLVLVIIILSAVMGVCIWRKRKNADGSLKPPPRPEKRRSLWDRLSRRYPDERGRPPRPEKRKSLWSRFSRRSPDDRVGWEQEKKTRKSFWNRFSRRQNNTSDLSVAFVNNTSSVVLDTHGSKPRCPSPKRRK
ncbi:uncharacterized protein LOC115397408 [Salarias fasciatus]|uniref:uncharacterized protein LOC115397408 n=1 Tax=Salarias fasciatus TaxID=181472 RepID=UPI001176566D|nr:uncharacterized protein LOC115397408 [Salarias fasciatus]